MPSGRLATWEIVCYIAKLSKELNKQLAIVINRKGKITYVVLGDDKQIEIPELSNKRVGKRRLAGMRLIHTHMKGEGISQDDVNDLTILRLDCLVAITMNRAGVVDEVHLAYLTPKGDEPCHLSAPLDYEEAEEQYKGLIEQIETELESHTGEAVDGRQKALLIHVSTKADKEMQNSIDELSRLADSAGITVMDSITQKRAEPDPRYFMGKGKLEESMVNALAHGINCMIFDAELTASQIKAIADFADIEVMDRTQLILSIFDKRASSRDGKIRVALARMRYLLPRLGAKETALSRIRGGIGVKGPGETTAAMGKRLLQQQITRLEKELESLGKKRDTTRKSRSKAGCAVISVVGYTNAGKSTLVNRLTKSSLYVEDKLFATLDPSSRKLYLPSGNMAVISDTVGLIQNMPESIVGVFRSTLEELADSNLIINLLDISDPLFEQHIKTTIEMLENVGVDKIPTITVLNKAENLEETEGVCKRFNATAISAATGLGIKELLSKIDAALYKGDAT